MEFMELTKVSKGILIIYPGEEKMEIFPIDLNYIIIVGLKSNYEAFAQLCFIKFPLSFTASSILWMLNGHRYQGRV